jgi:hypothetical protein
MNRSLVRLGAGSLLALFAFSACGVDDRALVFEYSKLSGAGSAASAGGEAAGDSNATPNGGSGGLAGGGDASVSGGGALASGGTQAEAGAASEQGGTNNSSGGAGATSTGSVGGAAVGGSTGPVGGSASAGSAGTAGAVSSFPCGDLNRDLIDDCSQTLVQNSRFDAKVSGWDSEPSTSQLWDSSNASGMPGSGSVKVSNTAAMVPAVGTISAGSRQCIAVTPSTIYDFAARVMLLVGEANGQAGVNAWLFDDDACRGNLVTGNTPIAGGVVGSWTVLTGKLWVPGGVHSMYVRLVAVKPFAQPALSVLIDDVLVAKH